MTLRQVVERVRVIDCEFREGLSAADVQCALDAAQTALLEGRIVDASHILADVGAERRMITYLMQYRACPSVIDVE